MTNLLTVLPDFDIRPFTHILPSLERALVSTADLLTLPAPDIAKRAQVPPREVERLAKVLIESLHGPLAGDDDTVDESTVGTQRDGQEEGGQALVDRCHTISTLDDGLDGVLNGGINVGSITEFVGESAAGKTQFLLTLLLAVQLPSPEGLGKSALYISTEAPLQTSRLAQILKANPAFTNLPPNQRPSLSKIQSTHIHDLEAQEHILRFQVPALLSRSNNGVGLLIIDSIAANYRPEFDKGQARRSAAEAFARRSQQVAHLGALLRDLARKYGVAVVVANQVADRFAPSDQVPPSQAGSQATQRSRPGSPPPPTTRPPSVGQPLSQYERSQPTGTPVYTLSTDDPLSFDHQQRFFTGWGESPRASTYQNQNLKTPSLGLTWTNQLATRIALIREPIYSPQKMGEELSVSSWKRTMKVVFSSGCAESRTEFRITEGGIESVSEEGDSEHA